MMRTRNAALSAAARERGSYFVGGGVDWTPANQSDKCNLRATSLSVELDSFTG